jgi:hypothetical protein
MGDLVSRCPHDDGIWFPLDTDRERFLPKKVELSCTGRAVGPVASGVWCRGFQDNTF